MSQTRILLVDDDIMVREIAGAMFESLGYSLETAVTGEESFSKIDSVARTGNPVACVFLDLQLENGESGIGIARQIRQKFPEIKLVVSSSSSCSSKTEASIDRDLFHGCLPKPYMMRELSETLTAVLGNHGEDVGSKERLHQDPPVEG